MAGCGLMDVKLTTGVAKPVWPRSLRVRWKKAPVSQGRHRGASLFPCTFFPETANLLLHYCVKIDILELIEFAQIL